MMIRPPIARRPLTQVEEANYRLMRGQEIGWDDWRIEEARLHGWDPNVEPDGRPWTLYDFGD
jgi:hypothetical protein